MDDLKSDHKKEIEILKAEFEIELEQKSISIKELLSSKSDGDEKGFSAAQI